jgi:hypothetical protein
VLVGPRVTLISFWGEQKPVVAIAATGFNFFRVRHPGRHPSLLFLREGFDYSGAANEQVPLVDLHRRLDGRMRLETILD